MNTKHLNGLWLIIVTLFVNNAFAQLTVDPNNSDELRVTCDQFDQIAAPMVSSTCEGDIDFSFEDKLYSGGCLGTIERIWTIRDHCGNATSFQQFIRFEDTTAPELSEYPSNISVSINAIPEIPTIIANDNCEQKLTVKFSEEVLKDNQEKITSIIRKWSVVDKCGNKNKHQQTITIIKENS